MSKKKALSGLLCFILAGLLAVVGITYIFDPFYQYHKPLFGMDAVLYDRDNQVIGTIRTLDYDMVLLGSSVVENTDSSFLDDTYDGQTLKIIRASASTADLLYYLQKAHEYQDLKRVFWGLDIFALIASEETTLTGEDIPRYLYTETLLDDVPYLFNKEILFQKIPLMFAYHSQGRNTGGHAYDWSADKEFSASKAMQAYDKPREVQPQADQSEWMERLTANLQMIDEEITGHPETNYVIFFPPYSMLWWDCGYVNGMGEGYLAVLEQTLPRLLTYENVEVYYFQDEQEIVCNLDNYMDMIHFAPDVNQYMMQCIADGRGEVTDENVEEILKHMRQVYEYIINEGIRRYYSVDG
ncbi:MAG: SGNH/GDSL hydrolase family protein [Clostridium sp.]|nr:SGNH/GDSL hydrolase family protein [Acetatifactor muris]MCM1526921.1 hypothetical protein [Bacteroides sp.]MCM1563285.1 SGNH/GDSL hydrolase family protein [Clostridium sp.]